MSSIALALRPYLDEIADRLFSGHAAVMVGSGFSKNAAPLAQADPFLDWSELGDLFYKRLHGTEPKSNYLQVPVLAHEIEAAFGRPALNKMLRDAIPDLMHEPSQLHVNLLNLPWSDVLTTNYDTLLERACRSVISQRYDIVVDPMDLGDSRRPRIIKLHGSLRTDQPLIVTDEDYRKYPDDFAPFVNTVRQALLEKTLCLIGFSGDDPNFLQWIGWIHDNFGVTASRKMYLIGVHSLSRSQRMLLERRNIVPIDMSECSGVGRDPYQGLDRFLEYLRLRRHKEDPLVWPSEKMVNHDEDDIDQVVRVWKKTRTKYPGWVVVPEDHNRRILWRNTKRWIDRLPAENALPGSLDLEFAFELTWRTEKSLAPIFDNHANFVEAVVNKYWTIAESSNVPTPPLNEGSTASRPMSHPMVAYTCHYLLLSLMRYYREEGLSKEWREACSRIGSIENSLSSDLAAQFYHERAMFAMFALNLTELKLRLQEWQENEAHPFWNAKKAALMAEIGLMDEAERILELSLEAIRTKSNLAPTQNDYTLASQESLVMILLQAVRQELSPPGRDRSDIQEQLREFSGRWHALRQYKCDPWHELDVFRSILERPPTTIPRTVETPTFDIGRATRTHLLGPGGQEKLVAYNFLRFCEDYSIPIKIGSVSIAKKSATGTLPRIAKDSSYWALATLIRVGDDTKAVDEVYDRSSLARMNSQSVDNLITHYLDVLRGAVPDIESGIRWDKHNFGNQLACVVPDILSRLCCKCSYDAKTKLINFLLEVYKSKHRKKFKNIRYLTRRLLEALTVHEQVVMIPKLLQFPVLGQFNPHDDWEFVNPFFFVRIPQGISINKPAVDYNFLENLLDKARSNDSIVRKWAVGTLGKLYDLEILNNAQTKRFGEALWHQTDENNMPANTNYRRCDFLRFPHPIEIDPIQAFMQYVRSAQFPVQKDPEKTAVTGGGKWIQLCSDIEASESVPWTTDDIRSIVHRLIEWWNTDRNHLQRATVREESDEFGGWPSIAESLREQVRQLVRTLSIVIARWGKAIDDKNTRAALRRVVAEMSEDNIPTLALKMACASLFPRWRENVLQEIESQNATTPHEAVVDALMAARLVSHRTNRHGNLANRESDTLKRLLYVVSNSIRWYNGKPLVEAVWTMRDLVEMHPGGFDDEIERMVLCRLRDLIDDTALHSSGVPRLNGGQSRKEVATKLLIRQWAAALAYRLFELYKERGKAIPEPIVKWERVCRSEEEFAEIRRQWIGEMVRVD